ncbi:MAG: lactate utilization protein [Deltaproteobacteria bacterium]|nr:lactate utilization protein [Deltaproteobacteria bacterium]
MEPRKQILSLIRMGNAKASVRDQAKRPLFKQRKREELLIRWQDLGKQRSTNVKELVKAFKTECELLSGKVYVARTNREAHQFLSLIIKQAGIKRIIKWNSHLLRRLEIDRVLDSLGIQDYVRHEATAELGISGVDYGLADTGTLVLRTSRTQDRATSLLPPVHVALMESERILPGSEDLILKLMLELGGKAELDSCLTLISGPSLTADIELNLVSGIHGPGELHVIILEYD